MGEGVRKRVVAALGTVLVATVGATAGTAQASHGTNEFSGAWTTNIGSVSFSVVSSASGAQELQALGGSPCAAPTTYFHGEYSDGSGTGNMAACTRPGDELAGRYKNDDPELSFPGGNFEIVLVSPTSFTGFYTADDPQFPGQFTYSGTFDSHFAGDGCCPGEPPPGGGSLEPPADFCDVGAEPARRAVDRCVPTDFLEFDAKGQARSQLRQDLKATLLLCGIYSLTAQLGAEGLLPGASPGDDDDDDRGPLAPAYLALCIAAISLMSDTLAIVNDPPDPDYNRVALPRARDAARGGGCSPRAFCKSVTAYRRTANGAAYTAHSLAMTANRFSGAVGANSVAEAFLQGAVGKVWAGELARDLAAHEKAGRRLAKQLGNKITFKGREVKRIARDIVRKRASKKVLKRLVATGLAENAAQARKVLANALEKAKGSIGTKALAGSQPVSAFASHHRSIAMSELAAIVNAYAAGGEISASAQETLINDLAAAQAACGEVEERRAALDQFVAHAREAATRAAANFLALGAKPLRAATLSSESCA